MKKNVVVSGLIIDAYAEFQTGWNKKKNEQTIKITNQIGDSEIFQDTLSENGKIKCMRTSLTFNEVKLKYANKADTKIMFIGLNKDPESKISRVIYNAPTNDCYLYMDLEREHAFAILVYRGMKYKEEGIYMAACHNLLDADLQAFIYLNSN